MAKMWHMLSCGIRLLILFNVFSYIWARKHKLRLQGDIRKVVHLTSFGFNENGYLAVRLSEFDFANPPQRGRQMDGPTDERIYYTVQAGMTMFGFTLDKSLRLESDVSIWDKNDECPFDNINETTQSIVFFQIQFENNIPVRMKVIRTGDLKNLTITLENLISPNETDGDRWKRSAFKFPISPSAAARRKRREEETNSTFITKMPLKLPNFTSVDMIPVNKDPPKSHFVIWINCPSEVGMYYLAFHNCRKVPVNMTVEMEENNDGNYLSVGQMPLPMMYFILSIVYFLIGSLWLYILCSSKDGVFKIHYLMLALMYIKSTSLLFHGVNFHFIEAKGKQEEAFAILFYIVYLMRGIFMFATIVLIGAGWTFVKHILSDRDKKIFVIVIPLQILTNVANIILSESEEGQSTYTMWRDIFLLVDLLCCGAILFPVVWSIRHLQQASQTDGKAAINLEKLKIFRHFYILVVCYIYFTRIIVLLLSITVPFKYEWLDEFFVEIATLAFFALTGYKFRPASNNPYLQVPQSDDETEMEAVSQSGALEGVTRVNVKTKNNESEEPLLKQRENSHEYD